MQLSLLLKEQEYTAQVAAWEHAEWSFLLPDETLPEAHERLASQRRDALPLTLIALEPGPDTGSGLLGCVTLDQTDLPSHDDLTPWLASLYVPPAFRGRGVGRRLADAVGELAKARGHPKLYLYTWEHKARYARWGFRTLRKGSVAGRDVIVVARTL